MLSKALFSLIAIFIFLFNAEAQLVQQLYSKAYGNAANPAILYLHGGPGYNSYSFEASTAEILSQKGYYVVVFDQRGCGRSVNAKGLYTLDEAISDVNTIYKQYNIKHAMLIGHSWGGTVATMYTEKFPEKVTSLVLVSAPVLYQQTFKSIINKCTMRYEEQNKQDQLQYINMLRTMDTSELSYANYCFLHAMSAGLYMPKQSTAEAKEIQKKVMMGSNASLLRDMKTEPVEGYYKSAKYTLLDLSGKLRTMKNKVIAIYGTEDGLFDEQQLSVIRSITTDKNFYLLDNASHSVFIDQQDTFLSIIDKYNKH